MRKFHLQHTVKNGPACQGGRSGGLLTGREHVTFKFDEFFAQDKNFQCEKCKEGKLFSFLERNKNKSPN